jgi:hypothetical protein
MTTACDHPSSIRNPGPPEHNAPLPLYNQDCD